MLRNILQFIVGGILFTGLLFKFMHWPGAGEMLITSLIGVIIILLDRVISNLKSKDLIRNIIYTFLGITYVLGIFFKVMHYKGADIMLIVSIIGMSVALAQFAYSLRKSLNALLPLLFSITLFFALFKILHWPKPPYVLYGSYLSFAILFPTLIFSKVYKLKISNTSLSNHYLLLGGGSFLLFITDVINKATVIEVIDWLPVNYTWIASVLLCFSIVLIISKTLQIEKLKLQFNNDYQLLKCLKCIYMLILVLYVLIDAS